MITQDVDPVGVYPAIAVRRVSRGAVGLPQRSVRVRRVRVNRQRHFLHPILQDWIQALTTSNGHLHLRIVMAILLLMMATDSAVDAIGRQFNGELTPANDLATAQLASFEPSPETAALIRNLRQAIIDQESDGDHQLLNPSGSGALGLGQVMPEQLAKWSQEAVGREVSPQEFLNSPGLQIMVIDHKLTEYWQQAIVQANGNQSEAIQRVAAWWYSGNPDKFTDTTPQSWNGDEYPSVATYANQILERFNQQQTSP
ncbi:hypothetical protein [Pantanalinema sp. GBBB05]|uniref:hypothetical protein n=1 Tax=Pantanalinema sp. GBBB05 TaxID=2604139 RepID=UPI001DD49CDD|nr:lytic transglycosylase domain-containing protein [Pantanalinema sp. GBBB05]